jgi:hypothetical protein
MAVIQVTTATTLNPLPDRKEAVGKNTKRNGKLSEPPPAPLKHQTKRRMKYSKMSTQARIEALQKVPSNGWIAFSEDEEQLIAYGATYDEVVASAEKQGVTDLVVVKVPETWVYRVRQG